MANVRKKISELTALNSASLDTTIVGVDNGTTYKIELDTLADAVTSRVNILDRDRLSSLESVTSSFETKGRSILSGSVSYTSLTNIPQGIVSQSTDLSSLNQFTASISTASLVISINNLNTFTASQSTSSLVNRLNAIESISSSWITESETGSFAITGSNVFKGQQIISGAFTVSISGNAFGVNENPTPNNIFWSYIPNDTNTTSIESGWIVNIETVGTYTVTDVEYDYPFVKITLDDVLLQLPYRCNGYFSLPSSELKFGTDGVLKISGSLSVSGSITGSTNFNTIVNKPTLISGSSQLTSSYDTRYSLSGSIPTSFSQSVDSRLDNLEAEISSSVSYAYVTYITEPEVPNNDANGFLKPDGNVSGSITYNQSNGYFTLLAGKTYKLRAVVNMTTAGEWFSPFWDLQWKDVTNNIFIGAQSKYRANVPNEAYAIITPNTNIQVGLRSLANTENPHPYIIKNSTFFFIEEMALGIIEGVTGSTDYTQITNKPTLISGSSQLTSSYDTRYVISGSITQTTWDNIASKPLNIVSGSSQLTSSYDNRYTLSGSVVNINTSSLSTSITNLNLFTQSAGYSIGLFNNFTQSFQTYSASVNEIKDDGILMGYSTRFNFRGIHLSASVTPNVNGLITNIDIIPNGIVSSSIQVLGGSGVVSGSYETTGRGIISSSANLVTTSSFNSYTASISTASLVTSISNLNSATSSYLTSLSGAISSSSQLTASYDTRYTLSGSVVSGTTPAGTISGSSQLTSSFDGRYVQTGSFNSLTASFNSFTASAQSVTTGSNSFNGTQTITGSLIITTGSFVGSQILANTSSLYLTSGSNMYVQNNGVVEITGSLIVSGSANFNVNVLSVDGRSGEEGGEINLAIPVTNTTLENRVQVDIWQNRFRVFEGSANAKGVFVDLSKAPAGVGGELLWKASGLVNLGVDVTLGDLKARIPSTGNKSLQISTTTGVTYSVYGSGIYTQAGSTVGTTINASSPLSVTSTPAYLASGYNFGTAGATDTWVIMDTSNTIAWRITMILGSGFNNNMISIERLV